MTTIDLNSDVGESFGNWSFGDDAMIISSTTSVNVACGFHAGDPSTIRTTCAAASAAGVSIGAHPGYRDLAGFGRRFMDIEPTELTNDLIYQIGAIQAIAKAVGSAVKYVKPHGALYNAIVHHAAQAQAVVTAVATVDPGLAMLVLPDSQVQKAALRAGIRTVPEAFVDRAYNADGTLVDRRHPNSVITDTDKVIEQALQIATEKSVRTIDGLVIDLDAESLCVHGDTPGAATMAAAIRQSLDSAGIRVESFA